jgi:predicted CoA-binding protein
MNPTDDELRKILIDAKTIAMVGASDNPEKPSHRIFKQLLDAGYRVIPVNPREKSVHGVPAVASLAEIHEPVEIVDVFRRAEDTPPIADEAAALGAKTLWLQKGISNDETAARAHAQGLVVVMDKCIGATHHALGIPSRSSASSAG